MKLRLPLQLATLLLLSHVAFSSAYGASVTITDEQTYSGSQTFDGDGLVLKNGGKLTITGADTVITTNILKTYPVSEIVLESGKVVVTGAGVGEFGIGWHVSDEGQGKKSSFIVKGGILEAQTITVGCYNNQGELLIKGGVVNADKITTDAGQQQGGTANVTLEGGRLNLSAGGIKIRNDDFGKNTASLNLISGTLGALADYSICGTVPSRNLFTATLGSGADDFTINTQDAKENGTSGFTITFDNILEGTGTGSLIKTGAGTLHLTQENTFTQGITLNQGTLKIDSSSALGNTSGIKVTGDSVLESATALTTDKSFTFENNARLTIVNTAGDTSVLTGAISGNGTFNVENRITFQSNCSVSGIRIGNNGVLTLGNGSQITGEGTTLYMAVPWSTNDSIVAILNVETGASASFKGIQREEEYGYNSQIYLNGGAMTIGEGGISFKREGGTDVTVEKQEVWNTKFYFNSGILASSADWEARAEDAGSAQDRLDATKSIRLGGGSGTERIIEANHTITISVAMADQTDVAGNFVKTGVGLLKLKAINTYSGGTEIREGGVEISEKGTLGTGTITMWGGTTLSTLNESATFVQNLIAGTDTGTNQALHLGTSSALGALNFNGAVTLKSSLNNLDVVADTTFGNTTVASTSLTKSGEGTLTFAGNLSGVKTLDITKGKVVFSTGHTSISGLESVNVAISSGIDLGSQSGKGKLNYAGAGTLAGAENYDGTLTLGAGNKSTEKWAVTATGNVSADVLSLKSEYARLVIEGEGTFKANQVKFTLGRNNAVSEVDPSQALITAKSPSVTGITLGSIVLDFDASYLAENLSQGGIFQLFSSGLDYTSNTIEFKSDYIQAINFSIMIDPNGLADSGALRWKERGLQAVLKSSDMTGEYPPSNEEDYLGADGVTVKADINYSIEGVQYEKYQYQLTPGTGTLIYQGVLDNEEKALHIADYSEFAEGNPISTGNVTLTNNGNAYGAGTNIMSATVVVDLSQGTDPTALQSDVVNGNLDVKALGTGEVVLVSGLKSGQGATLRLQAYGGNNATAEIGASTFTYANDFKLLDGSSLIQSGANEQIITGDITLGAGINVIANHGSKDFVLRGAISSATGGALIFGKEGMSGRIVLDGAEGDLSASKLLLNGQGTLCLKNGYEAMAEELVLNGGTLEMNTGGKLSVGVKGISGVGQVLMSGGILGSMTSWESNMEITFGAGTTSTITTGGANVALNKGVAGSGSLDKLGTGNLTIYDNKKTDAAVNINVLQGRLMLSGGQPQPKARAVVPQTEEYRLTGDLTLVEGKGASLSGMIDANNHNVVFGDATRFYLSISDEQGATGYIRNADTIRFGSGAELHLDVLDDTWGVEKNYTIFSANNGIVGSDNLVIVQENEFVFVDIAVDKSNPNEIGVILSEKNGTPGGIENDGTNKGAIHAAVAPLVSDVLNEKSELQSVMLRTMQTVSKMTTTEYDTYLVDMASSAVSYYTALSAQVYDATQHLNSVRNRVELINPVLYDDWSDGGVYNVWVGGVNHYRDVKSDFQSPGYEMTSWGGELGYAIPLSESFMMGVGFAYTSTEVTVKDNWGTNESDTYNVDVFARYRQDRWTLTGVLTGGFSNVDFHRNQLIKDQMTRSNSSSDGNQFMGTFEAMYDVYLNEEKSWILQPLVNLTAGRAKLDGLSETGDLKNAGLDLDSQTYNMFSVGVGAKIAYEYKNGASDLPGRVELKAMYVNDAGDVDYKVNGRFMGAPGSDFELDGVSNERSAVVVSAGWIAPISTYGQFFADASCEFRKDQTGVSSTVGFSFQF